MSEQEKGFWGRIRELKDDELEDHDPMNYLINQKIERVVKCKNDPGKNPIIIFKSGDKLILHGHSFYEKEKGNV